MNKIDRRHIYGIMLDTETANTIVEEDGKLNMRYVLPYDLGFAVIDTFGRVYETFSFANYDIYCKEKDLMKTAYYANKLPQYEQEIKEGKRLLRTTKTIRKILLDKIQEYDCKFVCAHNTFFDLTACNNIMRWTTKSKYRYFFPKDIEFWDTLRMARSVILPMPTYQRFCEKHGFLTKNGKPQLTAEILYRFIKQTTDFEEEHIGLQDVLIEVEILKYCKRQHKKMTKNLFNST
jgi:hypothetical protein